MLFSTKSSSFHAVNYDGGLSLPECAVWRVGNWLNNHMLPNLGAKELAVPFVARMEDVDVSMLTDESSPARTLVDIFWMKLDWKKLASALGELHICDIGCGRGDYGPFLMKSSGGVVRSYTGIDIKSNERWDYNILEGGIEFIRSDSHEVCEVIPSKCNVLVSNSAVEHFDEDLLFFQQLRDYAVSASGPIVQVHTLPSAAGCRMYGYHGVRQYTMRTLRRITTVYEGTDAWPLAYCLGGPASTQVHLDYICNSELGDLRSKYPEEYVTQKMKAISAELEVPDMEHPCFYALLIAHGGKLELF